MISTHPGLNEIYKPLLRQSHEIRLLTLLPGARHQSIKCGLNTYGLHEAPPYGALSYEWGTVAPWEVIEISGHPLHITPNLHSFLLELRHSDTERVLWADAICINQKNVEERGQQVGLMGKIYSKAEQVLAWLGEAADRSDEVLDLVASYPTHAGVPLDNDIGKNDFFLALCKHRLSVPFRLLLERTYWSRVWILQEVVLAKAIKIHCGFRSAPLDTFRRYGIETPLWLVNGATLPGSGRLSDPRDLVIEEIPPDEISILEMSPQPTNDADAAPRQRERPWPAFSLKGSSHIRFTQGSQLYQQLWYIYSMTSLLMY